MGNRCQVNLHGSPLRGGGGGPVSLGASDDLAGAVQAGGDWCHSGRMQESQFIYKL